MSLGKTESFEGGNRSSRDELEVLSVVVPAKDEALDIEGLVLEINGLLNKHEIKHEILIVNDNSVDGTQEVLDALTPLISELVVVRNEGKSGFGRAIKLGLKNVRGDAVAIVMADKSDRLSDLPVYWSALQAGADCVFGSRFIEGGALYQYPRVKLILNRIVNRLLQKIFRVSCNDITNAFKAYRVEAVRELGPFASNNFNITVELPIKMFIHGYSMRVVPTVWTGRQNGVSKLKIKEMGSQYLLTIFFLWAYRKLAK